MAFMEWSDEYVFGNSIIDQQHEHLFELVNMLYDSVVAGMNKRLWGRFWMSCFHIQCTISAPRRSCSRKLVTLGMKYTRNSMTT